MKELEILAERLQKKVDELNKENATSKELCIALGLNKAIAEARTLILELTKL